MFHQLLELGGMLTTDLLPGLLRLGQAKINLRGQVCTQSLLLLKLRAANQTDGDSESDTRSTRFDLQHLPTSIPEQTIIHFKRSILQRFDGTIESLHLLGDV
jgi:hypothetical protein